MALVFRMGLITFLFTWIESEAADSFEYGDLSGCGC